MKKTKLIASLVSALLLMTLLVPFSFAASLGDINGNGKIDSADARAVLRFAVGLDKYTAEQKLLADIDGDGKITSGDARLVLRAAVGLESLTDYDKAVTEYDILRSGNYYMIAKSMNTNGSYSPMELAFTDSSLYALSDFEGTSFGMLLLGDTLYMMNPGDSTYATIPKEFQEQFGLDIKELTNSGLSDFANLGPLDNANSKISSAFNGIACECYIFNFSSGSARIYMNGNDIEGYETRNTSGNITSRMIFTSVSSLVPASKRSVPANYTEADIVELLLKVLPADV